MFLFIRTVQVKHSSQIPAVVQFARDATAYLKAKYSVSLQCGVQAFSDAKLYVMFQMDSLDKMNAFNAKLMQDQEYLGMVNKVKDCIIEGSLHDSVVSLLHT